MPAPARTTRSARFVLIALGLAGSLSLSAAAQQTTRTPPFANRVLIDRDLKQRPVKLAGLDARTLSILDIGGLVRTESTEGVLAIITPGPVTLALALEDRGSSVSPSEIPGFFPWYVGGQERNDLLTLVDRQRLTGRPDPREAAPDQFITWNHPAFGPLRSSVDRIKRIDIAVADVFSIAPVPAAKDDLLVLANGDRIEGFVASVADPFNVEVNKKPLTLPWSRVASVNFAAPVQAPSGAYIWLADGSVLRVASLQAAPGYRVKITPAQPASTTSENPQEVPATTIPFAAIAGVEFDAAQLAPLSALPLVEAPSPRSARINPGYDQPLSTGAVEFLRPAAINWTLPAGASRLATHAELPPDCWSWGDCELVISVTASGKTSELSRSHLCAETPAADINVPFGGPTGVPAGSTLSIRVDEGAYGPIQDRVVLRGGLLKIVPSR